MGIFSKLKQAWFGDVNWEKLDDDFFDGLEESLILADVGVGDASLQGVGKDAGDGESRDDADQQQELEHLRQLVGALAAYDPLLTDHGHQQ